ncbi:DUF423 domain-containing protein [Myxosarcina sp. GI1]|uniref:DUF423 domain-containing protein n=1 Tax=Myxosarcina sp. GI1 TaxID=1541065 RepID=UPI00056B25FD|nr:DUF423 domain-containing protein [Myxosarcina sp. GI1]
MTRIFLAIASVYGGLSVVFGAFASHALKNKLSDRALEIWETGTKYQMYHALALLMVALLLSRAASLPTALAISGWAFIVGTVIFSGSLYALALSDVKFLGAITPIGGVALIAGWISLFVAAWEL